MKVEILDEDLIAVEQALVAKLKKCVADYDNGDNGIVNDMEIGRIKRVLAAIGCPHTTVWNSTKGVNEVVREVNLGSVNIPAVSKS